MTRTSSCNIVWLLLMFTCWRSSFALMVVPPAALVHTAVGFLAGSSGAIACYPIDYCKSILQTEEGRIQYKGGWDVAVDIVQTSGPLGLYRGLWINVVGIAPEKTIKLTVNTMMRALVTSHFGFLPIWGEVFAGGLAGATQVIVTNPLEVIKVKLQTSQMTVEQILRQLHGLQDLYQGVGACVARDVVFSAVLFPLYAHFKVALLAVLVSISSDGGGAHFWADFLAGSLAAGPAALIATPADVVKTRLQQAKQVVLVHSPPTTTTIPILELTHPDDSPTTRTILELTQDEHHGDDTHVLNIPVTTATTSTTPTTATTRLARKTSSSQLSAVKNTHAANEHAHDDSSSQHNILLHHHDYAEEHLSFVQVVKTLVQEEGPEVLFSGWFERVVRSVPQFGVTLAVYDLLNTYAINHGWLLEQVSK